MSNENDSDPGGTILWGLLSLAISIVFTVFVIPPLAVTCWRWWFG